MARVGNGVALLMLVVAAVLLVTAVTGDWVDDMVAEQAAKPSRDGTVDTDSVTTSKAAPQKSVTITVGAKGAQFKTLQAAINSVPTNNKNRIIILIANGVYR